MRLISEELQKKLPEGSKIEFLNGNSMPHNEGRDKLSTVEITFSNGYRIKISTKDYSGLLVDELPNPL